MQFMIQINRNPRRLLLLDLHRPGGLPRCRVGPASWLSRSSQEISPIRSGEVDNTEDVGHGEEGRRGDGQSGHTETELVGWNRLSSMAWVSLTLSDTLGHWEEDEVEHEDEHRHYNQPERHNTLNYPCS